MPPTFDDERKVGQEAEAWMLEMKQCFRIHDYTMIEKERIMIYNLNGRARIWLEHL